MFIQKWNNLSVNSTRTLLSQKYKGYKKGRKKPSWFSELKSLNPPDFVLFMSNEHGLQEAKMFLEDSFLYL